MGRELVEEVMVLAGRGVPVLTVNARLARHLAQEYDAGMAGRGRGAWASPLILPLASWAGLLWEEGAGGAPVLDATRGKALWERVVRADAGRGAETLMAGSMAEAAWAARTLMKEYLIPWPVDDIYLTEEARALKRWTRAYEAEVKRLGFVDGADLMDRAVSLVESGAVVAPAEVMVAGFDEITPRTSVLLRALEKKGTKVIAPATPGPPSGPPQAASSVRLRAYADPAEEVRQAARWARAELAGDVTIAIIVPELERYRALITKEFSAELDPASVLSGACVPGVFNVSLGTPLSQEPLVGCALALLAVGEGKMEADDLFVALRSPYLSGPEDSEEAARVDALLRRENRREASIYDAARRMDGATGLRGRCEAHIAWLKRSRSRALPAQWAQGFTALLNRLGWLEPVRLTSAEFQALKSWNGVLEEFSTLDEITGPVAGAEAAALLASLCAGTIHQPESARCRVQVMGLLETAGLSFDRVWLMGCHENAIPPSPSPNPFIPLFIQREHDVPRSSSERELAFSKKLVSRVLSSAPSVVVSYPKRADGRDLLPSPLFKGALAEEAELITVSHRVKDAASALDALEDAPPDAPIPVGEQEREFVTGGTEIIKNQSHCPFKAFAVHRLCARELDVPEPGLAPSKRGSLLHTALKYFWEEARDSARLREMEEAGGLAAFAEGIAARAIGELELPEPFSARFMEIERERLVRLLMDWTGKELARDVGFRVKKVEVKEEVDVGGLRLRWRIDRVDELEGGGEAIIDYKSGKVSQRDWLTRRPMEPQLLIYSTSGRFDAVSFARIVPGECGFVGISRLSGTLPGIKAYEESRDKFEGAADWARLMELWKEIVTGLASDFLAGRAEVDPSAAPEVRGGPCTYCGLTPLCRVSGAELHAAAGGQGADEGNDG
ncbi:MAG: PD-(D/E)XK nuclease family protein [Thermodesulfobacteriota bacterium]